MRIETPQLAELMVQVAIERFGAKTFRRRQLMEATEFEVRRRGLWTADDDILSGSFGLKSRGLADIDYRFSDLARWGTIVSERRNYWRLASPPKAE